MPTEISMGETIFDLTEGQKKVIAGIGVTLGIIGSLMSLIVLWDDIQDLLRQGIE